jgi:hypothetical protein
MPMARIGLAGGAGWRRASLFETVNHDAEPRGPGEGLRSEGPRAARAEVANDPDAAERAGDVYKDGPRC